MFASATRLLDAPHARGHPRPPEAAARGRPRPRPPNTSHPTAPTKTAATPRRFAACGKATPRFPARLGGTECPGLDFSAQCQEDPRPVHSASLRRFPSASRSGDPLQLAPATDRSRFLAAAGNLSSLFELRCGRPHRLVLLCGPSWARGVSLRRSGNSPPTSAPERGDCGSLLAR